MTVHQWLGETGMIERRSLPFLERIRSIPMSVPVMLAFLFVLSFTSCEGIYLKRNKTLRKLTSCVCSVSCLVSAVQVGYTGISCRCNYVFCSLHRYPEQHSCDFDFKTSDRNDLKRTVVGGGQFSKVDRL